MSVEKVGHDTALFLRGLALSIPDFDPSEPVSSTLQLPPGTWATLLDGLCARFPQVTRAVWQDRFARERVLDSSRRPLSADAAYRAGMTIHYFREVVDEPRIPFEETIVHADEHLVVADKPHFLPVVPAGVHVDETLLNRLIRRLGNPDLVPLHRIDRATAGLVLFSASKNSRGAYQSLFRERLIEKKYEAVAPGLAGLRFPLMHESCILKAEPFFRMREEAAGAPNSQTRIEVLGEGREWWHYALFPVSGRKHQLRVHMAGLGAPIRNDPYYPDLAEWAADDYGRPLQLLAKALSFVDPLTGAPRRFLSRRKLEGVG